ncbi:MAG: extracellular solute-binding protein [Anaerolineae bacterium]|nr:extracellular solute-binding protein [Anaerolineae bacterium]
MSHRTPKLLLIAVLLPFLVGLGGVALADGRGTGQYEGQVIRVLAFEGYTDDSLVKSFEEKYGVTIEEVYVYSNDDIFSNLRAGAGETFDMVTPTSSIWPILIEQGLLAPLDTAKLTNYESLSETMRTLPGSMDADGNTYILPFTWGADVLVYNKDEFSEAPDSYDVLFDDAYSGKIGGWDNSFTLAITALGMGFEDPFSMEDPQFGEVKVRLCEQYPLIRLYPAQISDYVNAFQSGDIVVALSGGPEVATALQGEGMDNIEWVIPKEGTLAWVDGLAMTSGARNPELVHLLIDHLLAPEQQAQLYELMGFGLANSAAIDLLPEEAVQQLERMDPASNPDKRFVPWGPVEDFDRWTQTWNEIKAGC